MPLTPNELEIIRQSTTDEAAYQRVVEVFAARELARRDLRQQLAIHRQLVRQFPNDGLYVVDRSMRYLVADGIGLRALGLSSEMLEGKTPDEVFPPDVVALVEPLFRNALDGKPYSTEVSFLGKLYLTHSMPLYDDNDSVMAGLLVVQDITEQKLMAKELLRQNKLLEDMHQIALDMLNRHNMGDLLNYIIDSAAAITDSDYVECSLLNEGRLVVMAATANMAHMVGDCPGRNQAILMWEAFDHGKPVVIENYQTWPQRRSEYDSTPTYASAELPILIGPESVGVLSLGRARPDYTYSKEDLESGQMLSRLTGLVYFNARLYNEALREIAERKRFEQQALELATESKRADVLSKFIQHASHEFRTPLAVMQTGLYLMNRVTDPDARKKKSAQIEEQIRRISHLVDMLVLQAVVDSGAALNRVPVSIPTLVRSCVDALSARFAMKGLNAVIDVPTGLPMLNADGDLLYEALDQFLDNAIRYSLDDGTIRVKARQTDMQVMLEVSDTGIGISPEDLPHVFERFYRRDCKSIYGIC